MKYWFPVLALLLLFSCKKDDADIGPHDNRCSQGEPGVVIIDPDHFASPYSDEFWPDSAYIDGDLLVCRLRYGGGCKLVRLEMVSNGMERLSIPPQIELVPDFTDEDPCEALVTEEFCFDLTSLEFVSSAPIVELYLHQWKLHLLWERE